jgi:hypothetical protein
VNNSADCVETLDAIIKLDSKAFAEDRLVNVAWDEKPVMMFAQDVRSREEALLQ